MSDRLLGVVLCGGQSSRMGQDKSTLTHPSSLLKKGSDPLEGIKNLDENECPERVRPLFQQAASGVTFLDHAIDRLTTLCDEVCLSGNADASKGLHVLSDPVAYQGPVTGITTALSYAHQESFAACLITPVDMPDLTRDDLQQLIDRWRHERQLTIAQSERAEPLVGIYPVDLWQELDRLAHSQDRSLSRWLRSQDFRPVSLSHASCRNINTPEDLTGGR